MSFESFNLDLTKAVESFELSLEKKGIANIPPIEMSFLVDVSGSFHDEHKNNITSIFLSRFVPWAMAFDPDKKIDVFTFSNGANNVQHVNFVTEHNYDGYITKNVVNKVRGYNGGTDYSYAIEAALREFGFLPSIETEIETVTEVKKAGFIGKMFGQKDQTITSEKQVKKEVFSERRRALCIVLTDGENFDQSRTIQVLRDSEKRSDDVYFMFVGMNNDKNVDFDNIIELGDKFSNTGFVRVTNSVAFSKQSDDTLNDTFLTNEFVQWINN